MTTPSAASGATRRRRRHEGACSRAHVREMCFCVRVCFHPFDLARESRVASSTPRYIVHMGGAPREAVHLYPCAIMRFVLLS